MGFFHAYATTHYDQNLRTVFEMSSFIRSKDMTGAPKLEMGHVTLTMPESTVGEGIN